MRRKGQRDDRQPAGRGAASPGAGASVRSNPSGGPEIIVIPADALAVVGAPWYYGAVAYPKVEDSREREKFMESLLAFRLKCCSRYTQHVSIRVPSEYSLVRKLHGTISKGFRCLERRLTAGSMAWAICWNRHLAEAVPQSSDCLYWNRWLGLPPQFGVALRRGPATVNKAAQALVRARMESTPGLEPEHAAVNIKHRTWAESLLALHLAIALHQEIESLALDGSDEDKLLLLLFRTGWLLKALLYAESLRTFLPSRIPTFPSDKAIRLLFA